MNFRNLLQKGVQLSRRFFYEKKCSYKITFIVLFITIYNYSSFFLEHFSDTCETILSCTLLVTWSYFVDYEAAETRSRAPVTSWNSCDICYQLYPFETVTKSSILYISGVLDPILITDIFASQRWILLNSSYLGKLSSWNHKNLQLILQNGFQKQLWKPTNDWFYRLTSFNVYTVTEICSWWYRSQFNNI